MSHYLSCRRAEDALELRALAHSWQEIADKLNYQSRGSAQRAVSRLLASTRRPTVAEQRHESREQLRVMRRRLFDHLEVADRDHDAATATRVAREIRANLEAAARLDGLNAPQGTKVDIRVSTTEENRHRLLAQLERTPALPAIDAEVEEIA